MKQRWFPILPCLLALLTLPSVLSAQDARSMGMGGDATAVPVGIFGLYWNPAFLGMPVSADNKKNPWTVGSGFSVFDSSNTGAPILRYDADTPLDSGKKKVARGQQALGLFAVKFLNTSGGVLYDQSLEFSSSRESLKFFRDRDAASLPPVSTYDLNFHTTDRQVANLLIGYGTPMPFGTVPVYAGITLKYHNGFYYRKTVLKGTFTQGTGTTPGFDYDKYESSSGFGLSGDMGLFAKLTDALQAGLMFQNLKSTFDWKATKRSYSLDPTTGAETQNGAPKSVTLSDPYPYAFKLGLSAAPPEKNITVYGEITWSKNKSRWRAGVERYYPENNLAVRLGTFADEVSNDQMWSFGGGYSSEFVIIDLAFVCRSLPAVQDSLALGGAANAAVRF